MSTIVDSFGQTFPNVQLCENSHQRSLSNAQNHNTNLNGIATINNGKLKSLTPPQMYELDTPVANEENLPSIKLQTTKTSSTTVQPNTNGINNSYAMDAFTRKK
jgi:hypothetical protein